MQIDCMILGDFQTNCYVVRESAQPGDCLIIDPGLSAEPLLEFLQQEQLRPVRILLTHGHCDHIAGIPLLRRHYNPLPICIGTADADALTDGGLNLSAMMGLPLVFDRADQTLAPGDVIEFATLRFEVLATPGHSPGGVSFYCRGEKVVFTGDSLFAGSIGRHDFPGGNLKLLLQTIRRELFCLPDATRVYSGHGPETTIAAEKRTNHFFTELTPPP